MADLLKRIGNGLVSFGSGVPQSQIDTIRANRDISQDNAELSGMNLEAAKREAVEAPQREAEMARLRQAAAGGNVQAIQQLIAQDPKIGRQVLEANGLMTEQQQASAAEFARLALATPDPEQRDKIIRDRIKKITDAGGTPQHSAGLIGMPIEEQDAALTAVLASIEGGRQQNVPAEQAAFEALLASLPPEDRAAAIQVQAGLKPRAGSSAQERIAQDPSLTSAVAGSQAQIREAGKFAEATGADRAKRIDSGFESINKIETNIRNLDSALKALDDGASTGAIENRFAPTIRASTVALEQVQAQLGLDVVQSVQFGALSEGELQLALATALPTGLEPAELRQWISDRKESQNKLKGYLNEQIQWLDQGGTIAGFLRQKAAPEEAQFNYNPETGKLEPT